MFRAQRPTPALPPHALVVALALALGVSTASGCDSETPAAVDTSAPEDAADHDVDEADAPEPDSIEDTATGPDTDRVLLDLDEALDPPGAGFVRARQVEDAADLIPGAVAQGMVGDWLLENAHGRYLVGFGHRAIGPCSWDGNPIETEALRGEEGTGSALGEICFLMNVSQTVAPEHVEILEDGASGRAVIAVTGRVVPLDFLNLSTMVGGFAPGLLDLLDFDPDRPLPFRVTFYYALTPESRSLRVLTAVRNDGADDEFFVAVQLVLSGSTGSYFTPLGSRRGWGEPSLSDGFTADPVSFLAYISRASGYAVVPDPDPRMAAALPVGAGMLAVSGAAALIYGTTDVLGLLLAPQASWPDTPGMLRVAPGGVRTVGYRLYPSDGTVAGAADLIYPDLEVPTTRLTGQVVDHAGSPRADVRVNALRDGERTFSMTRTDADGRFAMHVPRGTYTLRLRDDGVLTSVPDVAAAEDAVDLDVIALTRPGTLAVTVTTPDGAPTPARVVIACAAECPDAVQDSRERSPSFAPPNGWLRIVELGVDGQATVPLAPGTYRVSVNRGMTHTTWPQDATDTGGALVEVVAGEALPVAAEIAPVVDTRGTLSADFHIHAMASPDSSVANRERVLDMLSGGLEVMVSSDHDAVTDFQPAIDALGAADHIRGVIGNEITTSHLGHINAFPLTRQSPSRRGGAFDWSGGGDFLVTLQELIDATREHPGEQVVQLNHPGAPMGAIGTLQIDVLTGFSFADPLDLRMAPTTADPVTGDTGLWSEEFDAIELMNGFSVDDFWGYFRWWIAMVGRGFSPTGTAVTDTHGIYGSLGAAPRSFVFVDDDKDTPATFDLPHFVDRVRAGALVGTSGPFMRVEVEAGGGETAGVSGTLDASSGAVTARITLEMPAWIDVDTLDLYLNVPGEGLAGDPGEAVEEPVEPTLRVAVTWDPDVHRELVATGTLEHHRLRQVIEVPLEITADSYLVVLAHGASARPMRPVIAGAAKPLAFSNPVFLDFDGGGYDKPPLAALSAERRRQSGQARAAAARAKKVILPAGEPVDRADLARLLEAMTCDHSGPDATPHHHDHGRRGHHHPDRHDGHHHHGGRPHRH